MDNLRGYPREEDPQKRDHMIYIDLARDVPVGALRNNSGVATVRRVNDDKTVLYLVNLLYNDADTPEASLLYVLSRIDNASHILAWSKEPPGGALQIALVELPRLSLTFSEKQVEGMTLLYSIDHANLFVPNFPLTGGVQVN